MRQNAGTMPVELGSSHTRSIEGGKHSQEQRVDETLSLLIVDCLMEMSVKKCILRVQLVNRPGMRGSDTQDNPNNRRFGNELKISS